MLFRFLKIFTFSLIFISCSNEAFTIEKGRVGILTPTHKVSQLDSLFAQDSLVRYTGEGDYVQAGIDRYLVYDNTGTHLLLTLTPKQQFDPKETIETIQIHDSRFKTSKGFHVGNTFGELKNKHRISSIQNTITNVVLFVNDIDVYITIDKKHLPLEMRHGTDKIIEEVHIPDNAPIKALMVGWD